MGRINYTVPIFFCLLYGTSGLPRVDPLVDSNVGLIRGLAAPDGDYSMFMGIPYATVDPLNPFGLSTPQAPFESTFDAFDDSILCPQRDELNGELVGTIDCLRLNVFVPNSASSTNLLPVMVFIHGGGFDIGSGARRLLGPKFLVKHDVIVVTLNYRLGAFGFLCPNIPEVPGNQGLKDQLIALRWIKNNIEAFGGNNNLITLFGESAGAICVDFHVIYSQENLFNNVIMQSGNVFSNFAVKDANPNEPMILAAHLGFDTENVYDALNFLRTVDPTLLITAREQTGIQSAGCVENEYENVDRYIHIHPVSANITNARFIPFLVGFNSNEMGYQYTISQRAPFSGVSEIFDFDDEYLEEMLAITRQFYIGDEEININSQVRQQITDYRSDFTFVYANLRSIEKYFMNGVTTIYQYMFSYDGDRNYFKSRTNLTDMSGAFHADEMSYLFDVVIFPEVPTPEDQLAIDRITTLWTNFAKFSVPIPEITDILPVEWPIITNENLFYLDIDSELSVQRRPFQDRMAYWDLFFRLNRHFLRGWEPN